MSNNVNNYRPENIPIKLKQGEMVIQSSWHETEDIFQYGSKPYLIIGASGGGKTTLCYDIMYQKAKEATKIYYVSNTTVSSANPIINSFPNAIRSECTIENLQRIWKEITDNMNSYYYSTGSSGSTNNGPINTLATIYNKLIKAGNLGKFDMQWKMNVINSYPKLFKSPQTDVQKSMHNLVEKVATDIGDEYFKKKNKDNDDPAKTLKFDNDSKSISAAFAQETFIRLILNVINAYPNALNTSNQTYALTASEMSIIYGFFSEKPKTLFIIDDCTETLVSFVKDAKTKKINIQNSNMESISNLYNEFMKSILTRARHNNCLICIFVHQLEAIASKDSVNNIILLGSAGMKEIDRSRSVDEQTKTVLRIMSNKIFNNPNFKYHYVYYNQSDDPQNVYISKATLRSSRDAIEYNPICKNYFEAYDMFNTATDEVNNDQEDIEQQAQSAFKLNDSDDGDGDGDDEEEDEDSEETVI